MDLSGVTRPVVLPVRPDPEGTDGPSLDDVRGPGWRRTSRGCYVPSEVDGSEVDQRVVEAAAALPEDSGGVTGWADLGWRRARWFDGTPWGGGRRRPVTLAIGGNRWIRPQATFATSEERLAPGDLEVVDGVRVTTAVRSVCFEMRYADDIWDAATTLDMACFNDLVSIEEVTAYTTNLRGWTGIPQCRDAIALAVENAWSPRETYMRRAWIAATGGAPVLCNAPVFGPGGRLIGVPDLLDPEAGVAGDYDGAVHFVDGRRRPRDLEREDEFRSHGLEYVVMLVDDDRDLSVFDARVRAAYDRAARLPAKYRTWTVASPAGWLDTSTVAARRELSVFDRGRLLRHRAA